MIGWLSAGEQFFRSGRRLPCGGTRGGQARDRGYATVFAASLAMILVLAATAAVTVVGLVLAAHRARNAADLAALAAAAAELTGHDACEAAHANARANGARVTRCARSGQAGAFIVNVTTVVETGLGAMLPHEISADARAGNVQG